MKNLSLYENDKPESKNDYLGYKVFAKNIKTSISLLPSDLGFTCAIDGPWGVGKTTILNFLKEDIKKDAFFKYRILNFSPWNILDPNKVITEFFALLKESIEEEIRDTKLPISKYLLQYHKILIEGIKLVPSISKFGSVIDAIADTLLPEDKGQTLAQIKTKLYNFMKYEYTGKDFLIIIDDVDRLLGSEILTLMKLIKEIADFPHITYLLSLDKTNVATSINICSGYQENSKYGFSYLDKFVQLWWTVPLVNTDVMENYLLEKLEDLIPESHYEKEKDYLKIILKNIIFYRDDVNLRKLKLLWNSFLINYEKAKEYTNFCDLLAYTWLQLFYPDLCTFIIKNIDIMLYDNVINEKKELGKSTEEITEIRKENINDNKSKNTYLSLELHKEYSDILDELFPAYKYNCGKSNKLDKKDNDVMRLLICTHENFTNYVFQTENTYIEMLNTVKKCFTANNYTTILNELRSYKNDYKEIIRYLILYYWYHKETVSNTELIKAFCILGSEEDNENDQFINGIFSLIINFNDINEQTRYGSLEPLIDTLKELQFSLIDKFYIEFLYSFVDTNSGLINFNKKEIKTLISELTNFLKNNSFSFTNESLPYFKKIYFIYSFTNMYKELDILFMNSVDYCIAHIINIAETFSNQGAIITFFQYFTRNYPGVPFTLNNFWGTQKCGIIPNLIGKSNEIKLFKQSEQYKNMKGDYKNIIDYYCNDFGL